MCIARAIRSYAVLGPSIRPSRRLEEKVGDWRCCCADDDDDGLSFVILRYRRYVPTLPRIKGRRKDTGFLFCGDQIWVMVSWACVFSVRSVRR